MTNKIMLPDLEFLTVADNPLFHTFSTQDELQHGS